MYRKRRNMETEPSTLNEAKEDSARLAFIQRDINKEFDKYPSITSAYKALSIRMQISERTIRRIKQGTHTPSFQTLIKIYRYILGTKNDRETVVNMPTILKNNVLKESENFSISNPEVNFLPEVDFFIKNDSVLRGIYLETAAGTVHRSKIGYEYGQHGLSVLDKMLKMDIIKEVKPDIYTASNNRAQLDTGSVTELSKHLVEHKFHEEKLALSGENFCQFLIEGIDQESYNDMLIFEWETKNKRLELLKKAKKGSVKYWMACFTDTLSKQLIYEPIEQQEAGCESEVMQ